MAEENRTSGRGPAGGPASAPVPDQRLDAQPATLLLDGPATRATQKWIIEVQGHRIRVAVDAATSQSSSAKPPLLLCSGISAKLEAFEPFIREMPADRDIIRFDVPGVGGSPAPARPYRFSGMAALVAAMVRELGHERVDVLGISWGGALAQQIAYANPALCRRLVLVSTSTGAVMVPPHPRVLVHLVTPRAFRHPAHGASPAGMIYGGSARHAAEVAHELLGGGAGLPMTIGRGYLYQLMATAGWTSLPLLPRTRQPTLIVAGTDDPLIPVANARLMKRLLPHATLHLHGGGHLALGTDAAALALAITTFLNAPDYAGNPPPRAPRLTRSRTRA